jgi:TetR/AcrR family transcriptional regulator, mexJK operon transcriptional repressor
VEGTRRGRPTKAEAEKLTETVLAAAAAEFCDRGFDGARMDAIAAAAGITKRSLYSRHNDKHALFGDVIRHAIARYEDHQLPPETESDDLETALLAMGRTALSRAVDPQNVQLKRIVMNDPSRFAELSQLKNLMLWSSGHGAVVDMLRHHQARGTIAVKDIDVAAAQFLVLVEALPSRQADFGIVHTKRQHERHLRDAVSLFLDGVRTRKPSPA